MFDVSLADLVDDTILRRDQLFGEGCGCRLDLWPKCIQPLHQHTCHGRSICRHLTDVTGCRCGFGRGSGCRRRGCLVVRLVGVQFRIIGQILDVFLQQVAGRIENLDVHLDLLGAQILLQPLGERWHLPFAGQDQQLAVKNGGTKGMLVAFPLLLGILPKHLGRLAMIHAKIGVLFRFTRAERKRDRLLAGLFQHLLYFRAFNSEFRH